MHKVFFELKLALISEPCLAFPWSVCKFTQIVDSAIGAAAISGGLGAILCQTDEKGLLHLISFASRGLQNTKAITQHFSLNLQGVSLV